MKIRSVNCSWILGICSHPFECFSVSGWLSTQSKFNFPLFFQPQHGRHSCLWISQTSWLVYTGPNDSLKRACKIISIYIENTLKNIFTALWQAARAGTLPIFPFMVGCLSGGDSTLMPAWCLIVRKQVKLFWRKYVFKEWVGCLYDVWLWKSR